MSFSLPPIQELSGLPKNSKIEVLDHLFEPCSTLQDLLLPKVFQDKFQSYQEFIEKSRKELLAFLRENPNGSDPRISKIIAAHPRLGAPKPGKPLEKLSEHSSLEQKSLQGSPEEQAKLADLNEKYEQKFPGLRYVVFVGGRTRPVVMQNMIERIERNDIEKEREEAFNAMCDIALDRASKLGAKL